MAFIYFYINLGHCGVMSSLAQIHKSLLVVFRKVLIVVILLLLQSAIALGSTQYCVSLFNAYSISARSRIDAENIINSFVRAGHGHDLLLSSFARHRYGVQISDSNRNELNERFILSLGAFLDQSRDSDLERQQRQSLSEELSYRSRGENSFEAVSERNLLHWLDRFSLDDFNELPITVQTEILNSKDQFKFYFEHNTVNQNRSAILSTSLLSARVLSEFGLNLGLNTGHFNQQTLRTDNNVYFFIRAMDARLATPRPEHSQYGDVSLFLNNNYAQSAGWISAFVMYPSQLLQLVERTDPQTWRNFYSQLPDDFKFQYEMGGVISEAVWRSLFTPENESHWRPLLESYARTDMTLAHFEIFIGQLTLSFLTELYLKEDKSDYERFRTLATHSPNLFLSQVLMRAGWINGAELKVPVAVPSNQINVYQNRNEHEEFGFGRQRGVFSNRPSFLNTPPF